jgi:hypothetical protein
MPQNGEQRAASLTPSHGHGHGLERPIKYLRRAGVAASYPLRGIWYFSSNREFWPVFLSRLVPLSLLSFLVYMILFTFAFLPQYAFLAIFHGWGAWVNAVVLVLGEGLVIIQGLFEGFFVDESRVDVFDVSSPYSCAICIICGVLSRITGILHCYRIVRLLNTTHRPLSSRSAGSSSSRPIAFCSLMLRLQ